jgi:hypothetical protein
VVDLRGAVIVAPAASQVSWSPSKVTRPIEGCVIETTSKSTISRPITGRYSFHSKMNASPVAHMFRSFAMTRISAPSVSERMIQTS